MAWTSSIHIGLDGLSYGHICIPYCTHHTASFLSYHRTYFAQFSVHVLIRSVLRVLHFFIHTIGLFLFYTTPCYLHLLSPLLYSQRLCLVFQYILTYIHGPLRIPYTRYYIRVEGLITSSADGRCNRTDNYLETPTGFRYLSRRLC